MTRLVKGTARRPRYQKAADRVADDIRELRLLGLSYNAIANAIWHFKGIELTEEQVRFKCRQLGFAPNANMSRQEAKSAC